MPLSDNLDFTLTKADLITEALENIGVKDMYSTADTEVVASVSRTLQILIKSLDGLLMWRWDEAELPLIDGTRSYTVPNDSCNIPNPIEIADVRLKDSVGIERPCNLISISEYNLYVNKGATGQIVNVAFKRGLDASTLFVWPVSILTTSTLHFQYKHQLNNVDSPDDNICAPSDFMKALVLQFTADIAPKFYIPLAVQQNLERRAKIAWDNLDDIEANTSFNIVPRFK